MMHIKKGEIYLANLGNKRELDIGKIRPVLIFQNDFLNMMLEDTKFKDVIILPLSSQIRENDFTLLIPKRENLEKDNIILCNSIKMIDANRLLLDNGLIASLSKDEIVKIEKILYHLFDCSL
jgi:mRNA interferase MazF